MKRLTFAIAIILSSPLAAAAERPPEPKTHSMEGCIWSWKEGAGIGFWAEDCDIETGKWRIEFDATGKRFLQTVDGKDGHPVVYVFEKVAAADISSMLPKLRKEKLILDSDECVFAPDEDNRANGGRLTFQVVPVGKLKEAFEKSPSDEVPEPPCGELGLLPDAVGYFMLDPKQPDKALYLMLGQDQPLFDPETITFDAM
jgi:hypothetical protein